MDLRDAKEFAQRLLENLYLELYERQVSICLHPRIDTTDPCQCRDLQETCIFRRVAVSQAADNVRILSDYN